MNIYELKICKEEDKPLLIDFIKKFWQEDHAFVKSDELFRFQHYNSIKKEYSFILGVNTQTNEIDGIIGLIPLSQYDPALEIYNETWGGIWKVRSDVNNNEIGILGLLLFDAFKKFNSHGSLGMSKIAIKLHAIMKYKICTLNQYYILNSNCQNFEIAIIPDIAKKDSSALADSDYTLKKIDSIEDVHEGAIEAVYFPKKSLTYLLNRFQHHPFYKYKFWGVYNKNTMLKTILVTRTIEINNSRIIRIVDVFGSLEGIGSLKTEFEKLLKAESSEYIDLMNFGISPEVFKELGFDQLDVQGDIIIPNYFEPFVQKNIVINCGFKAPGNYVMFKADSDQDRPNIIS